MSSLTVLTLNLSAPDTLERSERTLRHALAAVLFTQVSYQFQSGLLTVGEVFAKIADENTRLPKLLPGDIDPICGLKVPTEGEFSSNLEASFTGQGWEACENGDDVKDPDNWFPVTRIGSEGPFRIKVRDNSGVNYFVHPENIRRAQKVEPLVKKAPRIVVTPKSFVATHEVNDSEFGWLQCVIVGDQPEADTFDVKMPNGDIVRNLPGTHVRKYVPAESKSVRKQY